jgi:hypothetical protein
MTYAAEWSPREFLQRRDGFRVHTEHKADPIGLLLALVDSPTPGSTCGAIADIVSSLLQGPGARPILFCM